MLTENDLRDVLDEWADAARHYDGDAPRAGEHVTRRRTPRWAAPLAAAAVVAATAITVTAVAGRDPHDAPAAAPTTSMSTAMSAMPRVTAPQQVADTFERLLPGSGAVTKLCGSVLGRVIDTAFDYDDGHGATEVQIRLQYPSTRARQAVRADLPTTMTCRPGNTAAPGVTWRAVYMNPLQQTLTAQERGIAAVHRNDLVVVIAIAKRPTAKTAHAGRLTSNDRVGLIAADRSWEALDR